MVSPEERSWCETHSLGHEFLLAANYLNSDSRPSHLAPTFVLYIHAIEMALKSYLLRKGLTKHQLQRISHNLRTLLDNSRAEGLVTSDPDTDGIVDRLTQATRGASIRYDMPFEMPLRKDVRDIAEAILADTQPRTPMPGDD
jgi:hypothetical protein